MTSLYDRIGAGYNATRRADPTIAQRLAAHMPRGDRMQCLDVACGTSNYTNALSQMTGGRWVGCDNSISMLSQAYTEHPGMAWLNAEATALPFAPNIFDVVLCTNALHHFADHTQTFAEMRRVLSPQGRLVVFSATAEQMQQYWLNAYFPIAMERSMVGMPSKGTLLFCAESAGFILRGREAYFIRPDLQDSFLYSGKHDPRRYLDPSVRAGISTFSVHADHAEIGAGCQRLADDLSSGQFTNVSGSYTTADGDYSIWDFEAV